MNVVSLKKLKIICLLIAYNLQFNKQLLNQVYEYHLVSSPISCFRYDLGVIECFLDLKFLAYIPEMWLSKKESKFLKIEPLRSEKISSYSTYSKCFLKLQKFHKSAARMTSFTLHMNNFLKLIRFFQPSNRTRHSLDAPLNIYHRTSFKNWWVGRELSLTELLKCCSKWKFKRLKSNIPKVT